MIVANAASAAEDGLTLIFAATSARESREAALAEVRAACETKPVNEVRCYQEAVRTACKIGGLCRVDKQIACSGAKLHCPKANASREWLFERYRPTFRIQRNDGFGRSASTPH